MTQEDGEVDTVCGAAIKAALAARRCTMTPCKHNAVRYGYCKRHLNLRRKPQATTYHAVHQQVRAVHGPASRHTCRDCGAPAHHWSYDNADPSEWIDPRNELPYSLHLEHYEPRCRTCHKRADWARRDRNRIPLPVDACIEMYRDQDTPLKTISLLFNYSTADILQVLQDNNIPINQVGSSWKWRVRKRTGQRNREKRRLHRETMMKIQNTNKIET